MQNLGGCRCLSEDHQGNPPPCGGEAADSTDAGGDKLLNCPLSKAVRVMQISAGFDVADNRGSELAKAWIDPTMKNPRTLHHHGKGVFMVGGETNRLSSKMV